MSYYNPDRTAGAGFHSTTNVVLDSPATMIAAGPIGTGAFKNPVQHAATSYKYDGTQSVNRFASTMANSLYSDTFKVNRKNAANPPECNPYMMLT